MHVLVLDDGRQCLPFLQSLKKAGHRVTLAYSHRLTTGYCSRYPDERVKWPNYFADPDGFADKMLAYVRAHKPDVAIAVGDQSARIVSQNKSELTRYTRVTICDWEIFNQAADKWLTMKFCMDNGIPCPRSFIPEESSMQQVMEELDFPMITKPRVGIGAIGIRKVQNREMLEVFWRQAAEAPGTLLVQEYIPVEGGTQYQAEAFLDHDSRVKVCMVISKPRFFPVTGGTSTANVTIDRPDIQQYSKQLLEGLRWTAAADVDFILDRRDGLPKILEINPRVTAGIKIAFQAGIDFSDLHMRHALGETVPEISDYKIGVYSRNFCMDILWYLFSDSKARKHTDPPFWNFLGSNVCYQTFAWRDPLPFFGFLFGMIVQYASPAVLKAKLGKD